MTEVVCLCAPGTHKDEHDGVVDLLSPHSLLPWERDGIAFCSRGHGDEADSRWHVELMKQVSIAQAIGDFYVLDAIRWDVLLPRTPRKASVSNAVKFHLADKWRSCCDSREGDKKHAPGCDKPYVPPAGGKPPMSTERAKVLVEMSDAMGDSYERADLWSARAWLMREDFVAQLAILFRNYLHWAISGELRYEGSKRLRRSFDERPHGGSLSKNGMRAGWFDLVETVGPAKAAIYAKELFEKGQWQTNFGGKAWAGVADLLVNYETGKWDDWLFVDRVFTTQHNTGTCLNKSSGHDGLSAWREHPEVLVYLNAHHEGDWRTLCDVASGETVRFFKRYWDCADRERIAEGMEPSISPLEDSVPLLLMQPGQDVVDMILTEDLPTLKVKPVTSNKPKSKPAFDPIVSHKPMTLTEKIQAAQAAAMANMPPADDDEDVW